MHPLAIIAAFALLGSLVIIGVFLVRLAVRRLWEQVHVANITGWSGTAIMFLRSLQMTLGMLFVVYGTLGTYRLIWGT